MGFENVEHISHHRNPAMNDFHPRSQCCQNFGAMLEDIDVLLDKRIRSMVTNSVEFLGMSWRSDSPVVSGWSCAILCS